MYIVKPTLYSIIQKPMALKDKSISYLLSILLFLLMCVVNGVPQETICKFTVDPTYCKTVLANQNGNIYDYGHISIRKSLSQTSKFMNSMNSYLQGSSSFSQSTIRALEDCRFLADLNFEYLSYTHATTNQSNNVLPTSQAEDFETFLSAVLANQQTCLDGLNTIASDQIVKKDLSSSLSDDLKLHSVTLALFKKGWMPANKIRTSWPQNGKHLNFKHGRLPLKMSNKARAIYDSSRHHGRKLLQTVTNDDSVVVSDIVVVSQDGSENFTTINDAIAVAPNNTVASDGYYFIYITEGVYQEYVSIPKNKKYLMMVGAGINQTVITGDHIVVDGFTTFNSATFGKQN
jgi:pectinesterase